MKKRKRRSKRNIIETRGGPTTAPLHTKKIDSFRVAAWCPDLEAKKPLEQVHFVLNVEGDLRATVLRFKSPDTIGDLIDQLTEYRRHVWPDAEPIKGETETVLPRGGSRKEV